MTKKIILSETQYQRLLQRLDETPFNKMVTDSMEINDILLITRKSGTNRFQIIDKNDNGVFMKNIDKGSVDKMRFFINTHSLNGSVLEMKTVDKNADQNILNDVSQWETYNLPDVKNIVISRDKKPVDRVDKIDGEQQQPENQPQEPEQPNDNQTNIDNSDDDSNDVINEFLINVLRTTQEDKRIDLELNNGDDLHFCCTYRGGSNSVLIILKLEVSSKDSLPILNNYNSFLLEINPDEHELVSSNSDIISMNQDGSFNLKIKGLVGGQNVDDIEIPNINNYNVNNVCIGKADDEEETLTPLDNDEENETSDEEPTQMSDSEAENMYRSIVNDPEMKKAFFSQPTFWQSFVAFLKDKKHPGKGIITALNTVSDYVDRRLNEKIGPGFGKRGFVSFNPVEDNMKVPYKIDDQEYTFNFPIKYNSFYRGKIRRFLTNTDSKVISYFTGEKDDKGRSLVLYILVNGVTDNNDIKICDLVMGYNKENPTETTIEGGLDSVQIQFYESDGYNPNINK